MNAYAFQAALLCEDCGNKTREQLKKGASDLFPAGFNENDESTYDADYFPKGPYPEGGGEADSPQHCDHCGVFLENPLTPDGARYLKKQAEPYETLLSAKGVTDQSWSDIATQAESNGNADLADWIRFYFAPGM